MDDRGASATERRANVMLTTDLTVSLGS